MDACVHSIVLRYSVLPPLPDALPVRSSETLFPQLVPPNTTHVARITPTFTSVLVTTSIPSSQQSPPPHTIPSTVSSCPPWQMPDFGESDVSRRAPEISAHFSSVRAPVACVGTFGRSLVRPSRHLRAAASWARPLDGQLCVIAHKVDTPLYCPVLRLPRQVPVPICTETESARARAGRVVETVHGRPPAPSFRSHSWWQRPPSRACRRHRVRPSGGRRRRAVPVRQVAARWCPRSPHRACCTEWGRRRRRARHRPPRVVMVTTVAAKGGYPT